MSYFQDFDELLLDLYGKSADGSVRAALGFKILIDHAIEIATIDGSSFDANKNLSAACFYCLLEVLVGADKIGEFLEFCRHNCAEFERREMIFCQTVGAILAGHMRGKGAADELRDSGERLQVMLPSDVGEEDWFTPAVIAGNRDDLPLTFAVQESAAESST